MKPMDRGDEGRQGRPASGTTAGAPEALDLVPSWSPDHGPGEVARRSQEQGSRIARSPGGGAPVDAGVDPRRRPRARLDHGSLPPGAEIDPISRGVRVRRACSGRTRGPAVAARPTPGGTSRSRSSSRRWAAGSRPGPAATTPPCTPTSRTSSSRFASSHPPSVEESRRLPASGRGAFTGPDVPRLRGHARRDHRGLDARAGAPTLAAHSLRAVRRYEAGVTRPAASPSVLHPANCRLLDPAEALLNAGVATIADLHALGLRSADHPVDRVDAARAGDFASTTARCPSRPLAERIARRGGAGDVALSFLRMPYQRDALARARHDRRDLRDRLHVGPLPRPARRRHRRHGRDADRRCGHGVVTCRFTHVYPDGPAPYFGIYAPGRRGQRSPVGRDQGRRPEAITASGGTITHHHAVGRDHRPWYDRPRPDPSPRPCGRPRRRSTRPAS